ncbi:MAG: hypothetical protein ACE5Z5_04425 [Candidatus Bathyarchaeia archaeon]
MVFERISLLARWLRPPLKMRVQQIDCEGCRHFHTPALYMSVHVRRPRGRCRLGRPRPQKGQPCPFFERMGCG